VGTSTEETHPITKAKILPPIPRDFAATTTTRATSPASATPLPTGEVDKDVFETMGASTLSARFEINIVKVSFWFVCTKLDADVYLRSQGPMVTFTRHSVPQGEW
jgi:hypothetical protein